jgi:hypothetical protein
MSQVKRKSIKRKGIRAMEARKRKENPQKSGNTSVGVQRDLHTFFSQ